MRAPAWDPVRAVHPEAGRKAGGTVLGPQVFPGDTAPQVGSGSRNPHETLPGATHLPLQCFQGPVCPVPALRGSPTVGLRGAKWAPQVFLDLLLRRPRLVWRPLPHTDANALNAEASGVTPGHPEAVWDGLSPQGARAALHPQCQHPQPQRCSR